MINVLIAHGTKNNRTTTGIKQKLLRVV